MKILIQDKNSGADPESGAFLTQGSGVGKKIKIRIPDEHPEHISESIETIFWVKILDIYSFMRIRIRTIFDPGSGMEKFGSGINIPDP
jgi:hypothetical protein